MERSVQEKIALGSRILVMEGQGDFNLGHVSALDDDGRIWIKPAGIGQEEITAQDVIRIDHEGKVQEGSRKPHGELPIHIGIYDARPDVRAIVHTHPMYAIAFGATGKKLQMLCHDSIVFYDALGYFDATADLLTVPEQGEWLAEALGSGKAALMKNHGIVTVGKTVEEAVCLAIHLEKACRVQLLCGNDGVPIDDATALKMRQDCDRTTAKRYSGFFEYEINKLARAGMLPEATF